MTPELWQRYSDAVDQLEALTEPETENFLHQLRTSDPELVPYLRTYLAQESSERAGELDRLPTHRRALLRPTQPEKDAMAKPEHFRDPPPHCNHDLPTASHHHPSANVTPVDPTATPISHPHTIGEFQIRGVLGIGGMGCVYEARDTKLHRDVALKVIKAEAVSEVGRQRFLEEARGMAAFHHDHIIAVHQVGEHRGIPFLVMPLLKGETLAARLERDGPLSVADAIQIGAQVADGLAAAHQQNRVHRDIKPSNVWLEEKTDRVKILDFGLVRDTTQAKGLTESRAILGTPAFMSPEQVSGQPADGRSDLFSLGTMLYQMLSGDSPFRRDSTVDSLHAVLYTEPEPLERKNAEVPQALAALVRAMLAKKPEDRPQSAQEVHDALRTIDRGDTPWPTGTNRRQDIDSSQHPPVTKTRSALRSRWWVPAIVAVVLLTGIAAGIWLATSGPSESTPLPTPVDYTGSVDLLVIREDFDGVEKAFPLSDPRAMPLTPGDEVKVIATVEPAAYLYLFWVDEAGTAYPLYPWESMEWGTRPTEEKPVTKLEVKHPSGAWFAITGESAGMETLLMLARPDPLTVPDDMVRDWFRGLTPLDFPGPRGRGWYEDFDLLTTDSFRAPGAGTAATHAASPRALQTTLAGRIGDAAAFSRAVSFARTGSE